MQHIDGDLARFLPVRAPMQPDGLLDLIPDGMDRTQAGHGLLEHHGDFPAADVPNLPAVRLQLRQVDDLSIGLQQHLPRDDPAVLGQDLENGLGRNALAAAAFSHHAQRLSLHDPEIHPVDGPHRTLVGEEMSAQTADFK